jgi:hypothetical protein
VADRRARDTCLHKVVVEVEPEQGSFDASLLRHRGLHGALDGGQRVGARGVVERGRQLCRRCRGQCHEQQQSSNNKQARRGGRSHMTDSALLDLGIHKHVSFRRIRKILCELD